MDLSCLTVLNTPRRQWTVNIARHNWGFKFTEWKTCYVKVMSACQSCSCRRNTEAQNVLPACDWWLGLTLWGGLHNNQLQRGLIRTAAVWMSDLDFKVKKSYSSLWKWYKCAYSGVFKNKKSQTFACHEKADVTKQKLACAVGRRKNAQPLFVQCLPLLSFFSSVALKMTRNGTTHRQL